MSPLTRPGMHKASNDCIKQPLVWRFEEALGESAEVVAESVISRYIQIKRGKHGLPASDHCENLYLACLASAPELLT